MWRTSAVIRVALGKGMRSFRTQIASKVIPNDHPFWLCTLRSSGLGHLVMSANILLFERWSLAEEDKLSRQWSWIDKISVVVQLSVNAAGPWGRFHEELKRALDVSAECLYSVIGVVGLDGGTMCAAQVVSIQNWLNNRFDSSVQA